MAVHVIASNGGGFFWPRPDDLVLEVTKARDRVRYELSGLLRVNSCRTNGFSQVQQGPCLANGKLGCKGMLEFTKEA